jgi:predicted ATPase
MKKLKLTIEGYKCFAEKHNFDLNKLTLLTGANSSGKSSVIQSLLLAKIVSETNVDDVNSEIIPISLMNEKYAMELGKYDDIINRSTKTGDIEFSLSGITYSVNGELNDKNKTNKVLFSISQENKSELKKIFSNGFVYLSAERTAPHYEYQELGTNDMCDCKGSNVGEVFSKHENDGAIVSRSLFSDENTKLLMQLDEWCNYVFPGVYVRVEKTGSQMYKLKIKKTDAAPNVGFGITYAFPILISGLVIPEGGMLIVENPEVHLHAKAQSNLGYFLARIAASGVRVIVETHSEHIVNGIRRMIIEKKTDLKPEDMSIYFFREKEENKEIMEITMDECGNLSEFPKDFFDQVRQDILELMKLARRQ